MLQPQVGRSGKVYGRKMTVEEVLSVVRKDRAFYKSSGGGMTLSGGEPTVQFDFCLALLRAAKEEGISTCLDTCGQVSWEKLEALLPFTDIFHYDFKHYDPQKLKRWTGADAALVEGNLQKLLSRGCRVILRCPIIPGVNDTPEHFAAIDRFSADSRILATEQLPYHSIGVSKALDLGLMPFEVQN